MSEEKHNKEIAEKISSILMLPLREKIRLAQKVIAILPSFDLDIFLIQKHGREAVKILEKEGYYAGKTEQRDSP